MENKKNWVHYLLGLFIIFSFILHLNFRNKHFQEIDSDCIHFVIKAYPIEQDYLTNAFYPSPNSKTRQLKEFWTKLFEKSPIPLKAMAGVGLGTTYSPMIGFLYGMFWNNSDTIESFNSKALCITLFVFHLTLLLLYFISNKLFDNKLLSLLGVLLFGFSYTNYNYAYHLGNYGWNTFCIVLWIYCMLILKFKYKTLLIVTSILCWFSYFLIPMFISMGLFSFYHFITKKISYKTFLLNNATASLIVLALIISFYPPNQGARGISHSISETPILLYYFLLNSFSFLPYNGLVAYCQFGIIFVLVCGGFYYFIKLQYFQKVIHSNFIFLIGFLLLLFLLICLRQLNFLPSRHFIFLYPLLLLCILLFLNKVLKNDKVILATCVMVFCTGIFCFNKEKKYLSKLNDQPDYLRNTLSYNRLDDFYTFSFKTKLYQKLIENKTEKDSIYFLQGTQVNLRRLFETGQIDKTIFSKYISISDSSVITNRYFIAYNPYQYSFNQANNIYYEKIKKVSE